MIIRFFLLSGLVLMGAAGYFIVIEQPPTVQAPPLVSEVTRWQQKGVLPSGEIEEDEEVEHGIFDVPEMDEEQLRIALENMGEMPGMDMGSDGTMNMEGESGGMNMDGESGTMDMAENSGAMGTDTDPDAMNMAENSEGAMDMDGENGTMNMAENSGAMGTDTDPDAMNMAENADGAMDMESESGTMNMAESSGAMDADPDAMNMAENADGAMNMESESGTMDMAENSGAMDADTDPDTMNMAESSDGTMDMAESSGTMMMAAKCEGEGGLSFCPGDTTPDREISISMREWEFDQLEIEVQAGEKIRITVRNDGKNLHEFMFMTMPLMQAVEYRARRADWNLLEHEALFEKSLMLPGQELTFVVEIQQAGSWMFMCMLPYHMQMGMMGQIATPGAAMAMDM